MRLHVHLPFILAAICSTFAGTADFLAICELSFHKITTTVYIRGLPWSQTIVNNCNETIWPAYNVSVNELLGPVSGVSNPSGGFETPPQTSSQIFFSEQWVGTICDSAVSRLSVSVVNVSFLKGLAKTATFQTQLRVAPAL
jgi:hypothetical protein